MRKAVGNLATYQKEHPGEFMRRRRAVSRYRLPDFAEGVAIWMLVGNSLFIIGVIMAIFSEVKVNLDRCPRMPLDNPSRQAVLICRDQDFRKSLWDNGFMKPSSAGLTASHPTDSH